VVTYQAKLVDIGDMKELMAGWIKRSATEVDPVESIFQSSSLLLSDSSIHHLFITHISQEERITRRCDAP
jgi:hypothetical protein